MFVGCLLLASSISLINVPFRHFGFRLMRLSTETYTHISVVYLIGLNIKFGRAISMYFSNTLLDF